MADDEILRSIDEHMERVRSLDEITAEFRDTRDGRRAQTQALLRLLDRLSGGGQPCPATG